VLLVVCEDSFLSCSGHNLTGGVCGVDFAPERMNGAFEQNRTFVLK
jgi:hypothetical protein